jgi:hypothetical protein
LTLSSTNIICNKKGYNMGWLALILQMLPTIVMGVQKVGADLKGHQKKAAAVDIVNSLAAGFASVVPSDAQTVALAATVATESIDGVVDVLKKAGALPPGSSQPQSAVTADALAVKHNITVDLSPGTVAALSAAPGAAASVLAPAGASAAPVAVAGSGAPSPVAAPVSAVVAAPGAAPGPAPLAGDFDAAAAPEKGPGLHNVTAA